MENSEIQLKQYFNRAKDSIVILEENSFELVYANNLAVSFYNLDSVLNIVDMDKKILEHNK
jgi:hypothetical protein